MAIPHVWDDPQTRYLATSIINNQKNLPAWTSISHFYVPGDMFGPTIKNEINLQTTTAGFHATLECDDMLYTELRATPQANIHYLFPGRLCSALASVRSTKGEIASGEYLFNYQYCDSDSSHGCTTILELGWVRANTSTPLSVDGLGNYLCSTDSWNITSLTCRPQLNALYSQVDLSPTRGVLKSVDLSNTPIPSSLPQGYHDIDGVTAWNGFGDSLNFNDTVSYANFHLDSTPEDTISQLILQFNNDTDFLDPNHPPPDPLRMKGVVSQAWALLNAVFLGQYYQKFDMLKSADPPNILPGHVYYTEPCVRISKPMFILTMAILSLNLFTGTIFFIFVRRNRLPWFPNSIASTLAYFAWSEDAMLDVQRTAHMSTKEREAFLTARGGTYRLGKKLTGAGIGEIVVDRVENVRGLKKKQKKGRNKKNRAK